MLLDNQFLAHSQQLLEACLMPPGKCRVARRRSFSSSVVFKSSEAVHGERGVGFTGRVIDTIAGGPLLWCGNLHSLPAMWCWEVERLPRGLGGCPTTQKGGCGGSGGGSAAASPSRALPPWCPTAGRKEQQEQRQDVTEWRQRPRCTPLSTTWMPPPKAGR